MAYHSNVIKGKGRGKQIGFPTFNLVIPKGLTAEFFGVYAAKVEINKKTYPAALHFGPIPTFDSSDPSLEVFVLGYEDEQPVKEISFQLIKYLRPVQRFSNSDELKKQIKEDVDEINSLVFSD